MCSSDLNGGFREEAMRIGGERVATGRILISKKVAGGQYKDLAILGPGDCLGEMALIEDTPRSARASAYGEVDLFELRREDLEAHEVRTREVKTSTGRVLERTKQAGFRACKRCHPEQLAGQPPEWIAALLAAVEREPHRRWSDQDIRALGVEPDRVRRWFQKHRGMTFHAFARARRLGMALSGIQAGASVLETALDLARRMAQGAPVALEKTKEVMVRTSGLPLDEAFAIETQCTRENAATDDAKEGPRAFIEKRAPVFTGRRPR